MILKNRPKISKGIEFTLKSKYFFYKANFINKTMRVYNSSVIARPFIYLRYFIECITVIPKDSREQIKQLLNSITQSILEIIDETKINV